MEIIIDAQNLFKNYGSKIALNDFSLQVTQSSIFGLLGPNGAGKTTAIEIMLGLRKRDSGNLKIFSKDPETNFQSIADSIGAMLQEGGINPSLNPKEALNLYASLYSNSTNPQELLERVGLKGVKTMVRRLSGGQKQSLSLAIALIGQPKLVFLDEPTAGMDPHARHNTWEIIRELKENGTTVVLTTHLMDEAELLCDEIAIVAKGNVVIQGKTKELLNSQQDSIDIVFEKDIDLYRLNGLSKENCIQVTPSHYKISMLPSSEFFYSLAKFAYENKRVITSYSSLSKTLEDIFLDLTKDSEEK